MLFILHIGFSKCASTFLRSIFRTHPDINLLPKSFYFSPFNIYKGDDHKSYKNLISEYLNPEKTNIESDEHILLPDIHPKLKVRATTLKSLEQSFKDIKREISNVKIFFVIRNHASLLLSRYSEYILNGGDCSFEEFFKQLVSSNDLNEGGFFQNYYYQIYNMLIDIFGKENVIFLIQELITKEKSAEIDKLFNFLKVARIETNKINFINRRVGLSLISLNLLRRFNICFVKEIEQYKKPMNTRVPLFLYKLFIRSLRVIDYYLIKNFSTSKGKLLKEELSDELRQKFGMDNRKLSEQVCVDLSQYGYFLE